MRPTPLIHLIWDWNGTLLDDLDACIHALNSLLDERGLPRTSPGHYREHFGFPVRDYYRALGFDLAGEDWDLLAVRFHAFYRADPSIRIRPLAARTLTACRDLGLRQSLLSACEQNLLHTMVRAASLDGFFERMQGVDNLHGSSKIDVGRALLAELAADGAETLVIGDTLHDHEVAEALGCGCILLADGHQSPSRLRRTGRPVLNTLAEVPPFVARLARFQSAVEPA
jgi:phosphoglycolate phosphatase